MTTRDINLATGAKILSEGPYRILRLFAFLSLFIVAFTSIVAFFATSQISISSIKKDQNAALYSLSFLRDKEAKVLFLNDRLKNIESILKQRKNYLGTISLILRQGDNIFPTTLSVDKDKVELTVSSNSLLSINNFLDNLIASSSKHRIKIKDLTIESLTLNRQTSNYSLSIKAKLL